MTLTVHPQMEQRSPEWFAARCGIVTASAVGGLITTRKLSAQDYECPACGSPAKLPCISKRSGTDIKTMHPERAEVARNSKSSLVLETASNDVSRGLTAALVAERINGWAAPSFTSNDMWRGVIEEPIARDVYSEHFTPVAEVGFMVDDRWGFKIGCSPDGLVADDGAIEIKSRLPKKQVETVLSGHPPLENMPQLQTVLLVSGRKWIDYVSFSGGMKLWVKRVYPDPRWFDAITRAVRTFEANAAEMIRHYADGVQGMPMTERTEQELEIQI